MRGIPTKQELEEKIHTLEKEKTSLTAEIKELREIVELKTKAGELENEVTTLREELKALKQKASTPEVTPCDQETIP